jgi:hypothetical protein
MEELDNLLSYAEIENWSSGNRVCCKGDLGSLRTLHSD